MHLFLMFCLFHLDEIYIILSKAAGGIYGDVNCVGIEASDKNVGSCLRICIPVCLSGIWSKRLIRLNR